MLQADKPKTKGLSEAFEGAGLADKVSLADRWCATMGVHDVTELKGKESNLASHLVLNEAKTKALIAAVQRAAGSGPCDAIAKCLGR